MSRLPLNTPRRGTLDHANEPQWIEDGTRPRTPMRHPQPVCTTRPHGILDLAQRILDVNAAWSLSQRKYASAAILKHTRKDFSDLLQSLLPGLYLAFGVFLSSTLIFTILGAGVGFFAGGVGAATGRRLALRSAPISASGFSTGWASGFCSRTSEATSGKSASTCLVESGWRARLRLPRFS